MTLSWSFRRRSNQKTDENANSEEQSDNPTHNWGNVLKGAFHDLLRFSFIPNLVVGLAFFFICIGGALFVKTTKGGLVCIAVGLTIIFWIIVIAIYHRLSIAPTPSANIDLKRAVPPAHGPRFNPPAKAVTVSFGGNSTILRSDSDPNSVIDFWASTESPDFVKAQFVNGQLLIDAKLYSGAELKNNQVLNLPNGWDSNFDEHALEIVNEKQNPVFQLVYVGNSFATVNGVFRRNDRQLVIATDADLDIRPGTIEQAPAVAIPRIFRYPSKSYLGERNR